MAFCMKCGKAFQGEGLYCADCMQQVKQEGDMNVLPTRGEGMSPQFSPNQPTAKKHSQSYTLGVWLCWLGILVGVILMIFAIVLGQGAIDGSISGDYDSTSFGADFYTYIYQKVVDINDSIQSLKYGVNRNTEVIARELGCLIGGFGAMLSLLFGIRLCKIFTNESQRQKQEAHFQEEKRIADAQLHKLDELCDLLREMPISSESFALGDKKTDEVR